MSSFAQYLGVWCGECRRVMRSKEELAEHQASVHGATQSKVYSCPLPECPFQSTIWILCQHLQAEHAPLKCSSCRKPLNTAFDIYAHKSLSLVPYQVQAKSEKSKHHLGGFNVHMKKANKPASVPLPAFDLATFAVDKNQKQDPKRASSSSQGAVHETQAADLGGSSMVEQCQHLYCSDNLQHEGQGQETAKDESTEDLCTTEVCHTACESFYSTPRGGKSQQQGGQETAKDEASGREVVIPSLMGTMEGFDAANTTVFSTPRGTNPQQQMLTEAMGGEDATVVSTVTVWQTANESETMYTTQWGTKPQQRGEEEHKTEF